MNCTVFLRRLASILRPKTFDGGLKFLTALIKAARVFQTRSPLCQVLPKLVRKTRAALISACPATEFGSFNRPMIVPAAGWCTTEAEINPGSKRIDHAAG